MRLLETKKIDIELPRGSLNEYGGASFLTDSELLVTTRDKNNHSRISCYTHDGLDTQRLELRNLQLKVEDAFGLFSSYRSRSRGQSYPYLIRRGSKIRMFFTDWYSVDRGQAVSNRLGLAELDEDLVVRNYSLCEGGFRHCGAARVDYFKEYYDLYVLMFRKSGNSHFPDYFVNKFSFNGTIWDHKIEDHTKILSSNSDSGKLILTGYDKTTCFNLLREEYSEERYVFSARSGENDYELLSMSNSLVVPLVDKLGIPVKGAYPYLYMTGVGIFIVYSVGRYGKDGLCIGRLIEE